MVKRKFVEEDVCVQISPKKHKKILTPIEKQQKCLEDFGLPMDIILHEIYPYLVNQVINGSYEGVHNSSYYTRNGKIISRDVYAFDKLHGQSIGHYSNGQVEHCEQYQNNDLHGVSRYYTEDGFMNHEVFYEKGQKHGMCRQFSLGTKKLMFSGNFIHGKEDGLHYSMCTTYGIHERVYKEGVLHGPYKQFTTGGVIIKECSYLNGVVIGEKKEWYEDGIRKSVQYYDMEGNKTLQGRQEEYWAETGNLHIVSIYADDGKIQLKQYNWDKYKSVTF